MAKNNIYAEIKLTDLASTLTYSYVTAETTYTNIAVASLILGDFIKTKELDDSFFGATDVTFNLSKSLADSLGTTDLISFSTQKFLTDSGASSDLVSLSVFKQFDDSTSTSDEVNFSSTLVKADTASSIDSAPVFNFSKAILDTINVTDDLDGEIGIDDDQNMLFTKKTSDSGVVSESISLKNDFFRAFNDSATSSQNILISFTKPLAEQPTLSDVQKVDNYKTLLESGALADNDIKLVNKLPSENLGVSDAGSLYGQSYVDNQYYFAEDYVGYSQNF